MEYYTAKKRLSPRASNTTVQKGDCRHTRAWTITMQKNFFFLLHTSEKTATHREGTVQRERSKKAEGPHRHAQTTTRTHARTHAKK